LSAGRILSNLAGLLCACKGLDNLLLAGAALTLATAR
jgi:hypothetical protein